MFKEASRKKLRFNTNRGLVTVEDLWDMPLTHSTGFSLDEVAKGLNREIKEAGEESFVVEHSTTNKTIELKFDIVKAIIKDRLAEKEAAENAAITKAKKEKIMSIIAKKEEEKLEGESVEDLHKMLDEL